MVELQEATVHWDAAQKSVILKEGMMETEGEAYGYFNDTLLLSGWGILEINAGYGGITQEDETTFFLAGYLEGYLTAGWAAQAKCKHENTLSTINAIFKWANHVAAMQSDT